MSITKFNQQSSQNQKELLSHIYNSVMNENQRAKYDDWNWEMDFKRWININLKGKFTAMAMILENKAIAEIEKETEKIEYDSFWD